MTRNRILTPSALFEQYCTPVGGRDGEFLCDVRRSRGGRRTTPGLTIDVGEALAAAASGNNDAAAYGPPTGKIQTPAMNYKIPESSLEVFPSVVGSLIITAAALFTTFALLFVSARWRHNRKLNEDDDMQKQECIIERRSKILLQRRCSWIHGKEEEEGELELAEEAEEKAVMSWSDLNCSYSTKKGRNDIKTLSSVTGHVKYKELVAIMGGSGGGKSTLMDILSGRKTLGKLEGKMSVLGTSMEPHTTDCKDTLRDVAAYVPQHEQFFPNQTPEEAVSFVANLKLGKDERGDEMREQRITEILDVIGLPKEARKRAIGGTLAGGVVIRGLSGGERKRLALACAIAMKPRLLFLDEITSGLDSENAVRVIDLIKTLCVSLNVAAVVVIHQPSYEVFSKFDRLILLNQGRCVYADRLDGIASFYEAIGRVLPEKHLIPSDILAAGAEHRDNNHNHSSHLVETCGRKILQDIKNRKKPSMLLKFKTVFLRQLLNHYVRNITNLLARMVCYGSTALLLSLLFFKIAETEDNQPLTIDQAQSAFGAGIFIVNTLYLLPFSQISTFFFDKSLFATESSIGLYPAWIYSLTQVMLEVWVIALCTILQATIAVPMISLWNPSVSNSATLLSMFTVFCITGILGNTIVLFTSNMLWSQDLAFLVGSAITVTNLASSGGFVPFPYIKDWIVWLQWISPMKYSFQAFVLVLMSETPTMVLLESRELNTPPSVGANVGVLVAFFILYATGSVIALSRQQEVR